MTEEPDSSPSSPNAPVHRGRSRTVVVGAGFIAHEHLACLRRLDTVEPVAVCDLSPALAEATAARFGLQAWYSDHRAMLAEIEPDVVHVATPPSAHVAIALDALEAGAHVFVEKPIALGRDDFARLRDAAADHERHLVEDHNYRFNPAVREIVGLIDSGEFGEVVHVDVDFCVPIDATSEHPLAQLPGGPLIDFVTHLAYLACEFIGPHEQVTSAWRRHDGSSGMPDELKVLVRGARGTASLGVSGHTQPDTFSLRVHGTRMRASASLFEPLLAIERLRGGPRPLMPVWNGLAVAGAHARSAVAGLAAKLSGEPITYRGLWNLLEAFYAALRDGRDMPISPADIEATNRLVWAMLDTAPACETSAANERAER